MFIIKYLKVISYMFLILIAGSIITSIFSYFNVIQSNTSELFKLIIILCSMIYGGIQIGRVSQTKGYIEGLKLGLIFCLVIFLYNLLGLKTFELRNLFFYLILIVSSIMGSMIGINMKKKSND